MNPDPMQPLDSVQIQIQVGPRSAQGRVVDLDLTRGVVELLFDTASDLRLPLATRVTTLVHLPHRRRPISLPAWVLSWSCNAHGVTYSLLYQEESVTRLAAMANVRESLRVQPDPSAPCLVEVRSPNGGDSIFGELDDLSESGLGLRLDAELEDWMLGSGNELEVRFRLPGAGELSFLVLVRQRRMQGTQVRYGLAMIPGEDFEQQRRAVYQYMTRRQVQARDKNSLRRSA